MGEYVVSPEVRLVVDGVVHGGGDTVTLTELQAARLAHRVTPAPASIPTPAPLTTASARPPVRPPAR